MPSNADRTPSAAQDHEPDNWWGEQPMDYATWEAGTTSYRSRRLRRRMLNPVFAFHYLLTRLRLFRV